MGATERLASFAASLRLEDVPPSAVDQAKLAVLDWVGVALAGRRSTLGPLIVEHARGQAGDGSSTIIGGPGGVAASGAALANGTLAHALDFDDRGHASTHGLATALAIGEMQSASGADLLAAYIAGREIRMSLDLAIDAGRGEGFGPGSRGWHATGTNGAISSAVTGALLMGADAGQVRTAIGIAASMSGGLIRNFGTMTKPLHAGHAAQAGVTAALLAAAGFTSDPDILEAPSGYLNALCLPGEVDPEALGTQLGRHWDLVQRGVRIKPYPSCTSTHGSIEAARVIRQEPGFAAEEIELVELDFRPFLLLRIMPKDFYERRFSMPYCVSVALLEGRVDMDHFTDDYAGRPEVTALLDRFVPRPGSGDLVVTTRSGATFSRPVPGYRNLATTEEIIGKFRETAGPSLSPAQQDEVIRLALHLEAVDDVREVGAILASAALSV